jgi:hypothetical protein
MGDVMTIAYALTTLAQVAAERHQPERAGRLWGAIEAEVGRRRIGQWEEEREDLEKTLSVVRGPEFEQGREAGRRSELDEAVAYALSVD